MTTSTPPPPVVTTTRPYTSYNLFFQLERQYILVSLGFQPTIPPTEIFDPTDAGANYPSHLALPSRYTDLTLLYDWHIPGKARRRKRTHRKSHGVIGFHELNEKISRAWSTIDDETRQFCVMLSAIEARKYKKVNKVTKKKMAWKTNEMMKIAHEMVMADAGNDDRLPFDWSVDHFPQENFIMNDNPHPTIETIPSPATARPKISRMVSREDSGHSMSFAEVDMGDDEIIDIWKSIPDGVDSYVSRSSNMLPFALSHVCVTIDDNGLQNDNGDFTRTSFIDAEYDMFKEIGKQFRTVRKQQKLSSLLVRKSCTARQA